MRIARHLALTLALLALPGAALAQSKGGGQGGGHDQRGPGGGPGGPGGGPGGGLVIAPDGKALVIERTAGSGDTAATFELTAISTTGTIAWTHAAPSAIHRVIATSSLVVLSLGGDRDAETATSQLVALSLASGTQAWSLAIDGSIRGVEAVSAGFLVEVVKVTAASGTTAASAARSLQLVSPAGAVLWTFSLNG